MEDDASCIALAFMEALTLFSFLVAILLWIKKEPISCLWPKLPLHPGSGAASGPGTSLNSRARRGDGGTPVNVVFAAAEAGAANPVTFDLWTLIFQSLNVLVVMGVLYFMLFTRSTRYSFDLAAPRDYCRVAERTQYCHFSNWIGSSS